MNPATHTSSRRIGVHGVASRVASWAGRDVEAQSQAPVGPAGSVELRALVVTGALRRLVCCMALVFWAAVPSASGTPIAHDQAEVAKYGGRGLPGPGEVKNH